MLRRILGLAAGVAVLALALPYGPLSVSAMSSSAQANKVVRLETQPLMIRLQTGKQVFFTVEVANEVDEQRTGLMFRTELDEDEGMVFLYPRARFIGMWMKNTLIPLDMVFMKEDGRILNVHENAEPGSLESIRSQGLSVAVLEIQGGLAAKLGLSAGDQVFHCHFNNFPCKTDPPANP